MPPERSIEFKIEL
jgi:hypothetical protein